MLTRNFGRVYRLPDRHDTGYAGFGYGGDRLYVVCLVDCFDPPRYVVRADSFEDALDVAIECLSPTVEREDVDADEWDRLEQGQGEWLTISPSGRVVSSDDDIQIRLWCMAHNARWRSDG